ncbi:MAG TPA: hypothetical protein VFT22_26340 [Kofleriaceae bacterium]|nr:hypothetical protein [Kofleriaceae bacterium]
MVLVAAATGDFLDRVQHDRDFGLCFIKFSSYAPFGVRIWANGHEWAKRKLDARGIRYEELDNGFLSCDDATALQDVCDRFSAEHVEAFSP